MATPNPLFVCLKFINLKIKHIINKKTYIIFIDFEKEGV